MTAMRTPERFPPPRLGAWSLMWRWLLAAGWYALVMLAYLLGQDDAELVGAVPPVWAMVADLTLGLVALGLLAVRRRWPFAVALATIAISAVSVSALVAATWAFVSLASRRRWVLTLGAVIASGVASVPRRLLPWSQPTPEGPAGGGDLVVDVLIGVLVVFLSQGLLALLGAYVGVRHDRQAAQLAVAAAAVRDRELAVLAERNRIAREMHDVLAHRISLVAMHAGVLSYRADLTPEQTREIAGVIQENAHASLSELRSVLTSLRDDLGVDPPQPTLERLGDLFAEAVASGQRLEVADTRGTAVLSPVVGRHAYRIVQECLTNARKHAPGAVVALSLSGAPGSGLAIECRNPIGSPAVIPGAGLGLIGIGERVAMLGGTLDTGLQDGQFRVQVWLPWVS